MTTAQKVKVRAFAALGKGQALVPYEYERREPGAGELEVKVECCGMCHSDLHLIDNDWGFSRFPLVPGHEIVGTVSHAGASVTGFRQGDRVGIGWQAASCGRCDDCLSGDENYCPENQGVCVPPRYGGYGEYAYADSRFAFKIPEALASDKCAPLLCGGATVYSPLRSHGVHPGMKVGIVGIGGLGHLALQFANALGCEVTAFSSTAEKEKEVRDLGASHFVLTTDAAQMKALERTFDFILSTVHVAQPWDAYLACLRTRGTFCLVGAPSDEVRFKPFSLMLGERKFAGSVIASPAMIREMLGFCAVNRIQAKTEVLPLADCNKGLEKLRTKSARYRVVLRVAH